MLYRAHDVHTRDICSCQGAVFYCLLLLTSEDVIVRERGVQLLNIEVWRRAERKGVGEKRRREVVKRGCGLVKAVPILSVQGVMEGDSLIGYRTDR